MGTILEAALAAVGIRLPPGALDQVVKFCTDAGLQHSKDAGAAAAAKVNSIDDALAAFNEEQKP